MVFFEEGETHQPGNICLCPLQAQEKGGCLWLKEGVLASPGRRAADAGQGGKEAISSQPSRKGADLLLPSPSLSKALQEGSHHPPCQIHFSASLPPRSGEGALHTAA